MSYPRTKPDPSDDLSVERLGVGRYAVVGTVSQHVYAWRPSRESAEREALRLTSEGGPR